jgi:predicted RNase H-like HicB family nuclease
MIQSVQDGVDILLTDYIEGALKKARYEILSDDGSYYGEIPGFQGVYANASTLEECRHELKEVLEDWILLGISRHSALPLIDGIDLKVREAV